jgi:hypothetical protein
MWRLSEQQKHVYTVSASRGLQSETPGVCTGGCYGLI